MRTQLPPSYLDTFTWMTRITMKSQSEGVTTIAWALRDKVKRGDLGRWRPPKDRLDPIDLIEEAHAGRLERLIPVRVGRMAVSPYAFLRGAASLMAEDFARMARTGIEPVICGDAHLGNFGFYASPERNLVFDLNDFDEAHPGPLGVGSVAAGDKPLGGRPAKPPARRDLRGCRTVVRGGLPPADWPTGRAAAVGSLV
jgi:hypothetical protein